VKAGFQGILGQPKDLAGLFGRELFNVSKDNHSLGQPGETCDAAPNELSQFRMFDAASARSAGGISLKE
jgi:hypothetical protein